jgi:hypothetical protein
LHVKPRGQSAFEAHRTSIVTRAVLSSRAMLHAAANSAAHMTVDWTIRSIMLPRTQHYRSRVVTVEFPLLSRW